MKYSMKKILLICTLCVSFVTDNPISGNEPRPELNEIQASRLLTPEQKIALKNERNELEQRAAKGEVDSEDGIDEPSRMLQAISVAALSDEDGVVEEKSVSSNYVTTHDGVFHFPVSLYAGTVGFEDGSVWNVDPNAFMLMSNWMTYHNIIVLPPRWFSYYDYSLLNLNTGLRVDADLSITPMYDGNNTYYITAIDTHNGVVYLNDNSMWKISYFDQCILNRWNIDDTIILGINNGWFSFGRPNILINASLNEYVKSRCLY